MRARRLQQRACVQPRTRRGVSIPGWVQQSFLFERIDEDRVRLAHEVEIVGEQGSPNAGQKFFADDLELNIKTGELTARGNVVFLTPTAQISAESIVFNTKTKMGTFTNASASRSSANAGQRNMSMFGTPNRRTSTSTARRSRRSARRNTRSPRGLPSKCVQPTPRWRSSATPPPSISTITSSSRTPSSP
jgi:hypothetical protein